MARCVRFLVAQATTIHIQCDNYVHAGWAALLPAEEIYVCMRVCVYIYIYIYMNTHTLNTYTHIHTYIHTYIQRTKHMCL